MSDTIFTSQGMKKIIVIVLCTLLFDVVILASVPSAYANEWPMFHHDLQHTGYSTSNAPNTNNILWTFTTGDDVYSSPAIVNGKVYVGSDDGHLYCLDAEDGDELWNSTIGGETWFSSPAIEDGQVYIGGNGLHCLNTDNGSIIWVYPSGLHISSSPAVVDDRVYVGTWYEGLCCFDTDPDDNGDGVINHNPYDEIEDDDDEGYNDSTAAEYDLIWKYETGNMVLSSPAIYNGMIFIGSQDKKIYCLPQEDPDGDGIINSTEEIWNFTTNGIVKSSPAIAYGKVYIGSDDRKIYCLYTNNGTEKWRYTTHDNVWSSPAVADEKVYIGLGFPVGKIYCLDATSGLPVWDEPFVTGGGITSSPAIADGKIYVGSMDNKIYCLDADYGTKIWEYETGSFIDYSSPAIADGRLYIGSRDNIIYCFGDEGNQPPSKPSKPSGIMSGSIGTEYSYLTITTDPDGDQVYYKWDWGDGENSGWLGPYSSGEIISASHAWSTTNDYKVKVKAKDNHSSESLWSESLEVTITEPIPELLISCQSSVLENEDFTVTVTSNGEPIKNVTVEINGNTNTTNPSGQANFTAPEVTSSETYTITATLEGYTEDTETITVLNRIEKKGWIYGVVSSKSSPLEDAKITIASGDEKWVKYTTDEGRYVQSLPPGTYTVEASKQGYKTSIEQDVIVLDKNATGLDFALEKDLDSSTDTSEQIDYIDYTIAQKGADGTIGARMDVFKPGQESTLYYSDELVIEINSTKEVVSFTVSAENGTNGTILVIRIGEGVLSDLDDLNVTYDGMSIDEVFDIAEFFNLQDNTTLGWLRLLTIKGLYIFVRVPEFSEHTVAISSAISGLVGFIAVIFYIIISTIVFILFLAPMLANVIRRRMRFR